MPTHSSAACLLSFVLAGAAPSVAALELREVRVEGIADEAMRDDVADALSLQRLEPGRRATLSESRLSYLLRRTPGEVRAAMEPYGYYAPEIAPDVRRDGDHVDVVVRVVPGEPVRVTARDITLTGPAAADSTLMRLLGRFRPRDGQVFHHGTYEDGKARIDRALAERGYFDAALPVHTVRVERATRSAAIELAWTSGERYALGDATFHGHPFRPGLLENLVPWTPGEPYRQSELLDLQRSLAGLDYFAAIDITADPDAAGADRQVPVDVALAPAKRSVWSAGVRYGTDTGLGVTAGLDRRWVNDRGHKFRALAQVAERRTDLAAQYRIPAFAWLDGWYALGANVREEEVDGVAGQLLEVIASRSGRLDDWTLTAAVNVRRERFDDVATGFTRSYSTLVYPSLLAQWSRSDDLLYPRSALGFTTELRGGHSAIGSDVDFLQLRAEGRWVHGNGRRQRLLLPPRPVPPSATTSTRCRRRCASMPVATAACAGTGIAASARSRPTCRGANSRSAASTSSSRASSSSTCSTARGARRCSSTPAMRSTRPTISNCSPAPASACAGARRSGRCGWMSRMVSATRRGSRCACT